MLGRRTLFSAAATTGAAIASFFTGRTAAAKSSASSFVGDVEPRGTDGRLERLPTLDLESTQDFLTGFRTKINTEFEGIALKRSRKVLEDAGLNPYGDHPMETVLPLLENDPVIGARTRLWIGSQQVTWKTLQDHFHEHADVYLEEMEAADNAGPGTLELNPDMEIPEYTKHEIHIQPGGYVGDPFAGHIYHYGTNMFFAGRNFQDELHLGHARDVAAPEDGKVLRVLELGSGSGQLTVALKERFPEAEVWGVDVGGPMVRYAHMRAADLGVDVNFAQRLAEDTKFPDGHFDIVMSHLFFHELTEQASKNVIAEVHRILRPGGTFFPIDLWSRGQRPGPQAFQKYTYWFNHRWNGEVWFMEYANLDLEGTMREVGFDVNERVRGRQFFENLTGTKKA
ncbi:MAG: class I SAM-dependent methyltransferase [Rhodospirillaceae bacterium]|jgi:SAM-dependent methyltransferase|nr:class I SAM-dependent methyltransferase [Rhodospirillaceae bacterium]MBT5238970.1 class I SAM-dependent methyltransferase [Rhodospirillaceae bacterium]MBT5565186.1 class I SAM-dependent methyltransferase [Rhodospirillaceae bacterium]MBT7450414.1 class I SAM-dependent methyltransferase [Rhodospirillaceae bacterium]